MEPLRPKRMALIALLLSCLLFVSYSAMGVLAEDCLYTIYVQTGTVLFAGTNSIITLDLYNEKGESVTFKNLAKSGTRGGGGKYFKNGNLDVFRRTARCLTSSVCKMNVTSDGTGIFPGWYLNYIEVSKLWWTNLQDGTSSVSTGDLCYDQKFLIDRWLAVDEPPNTLWASKDFCTNSTEALDNGVIQTRPAI